MTKLEYTFQSDVLFKMLFVRNQGLLRHLIAVLLSIPLDSITSLVVTNTEIPPEEVGNKFCRLDIRMTADGKDIDIELQAYNEGNYPARMLYYASKMVAGNLLKGEDYNALPRTIVISILGFNLFPGPDMHSEFALLERTRHHLLTDKLGFHFFELPKLPTIQNLDTSSQRNLWLSLFNAQTEEELTQLEQEGGPLMSEAVTAYRTVTATPEFKQLEWMRQKTKLDEQNALSVARKAGKEEMIIAAIRSNLPKNSILAMCQLAGITPARLEEILQEL